MEVKEKIIEIPEGVTINYDKNNNEISVKGPKGELKKKFFYDQFELKIEGNKIIFKYPIKTKSQKKNAHTVISIIQNLIKGVTEGYTYKLKIFYKHFPIQVKVKGNIVEVVNFLGEKAPRVLELDEDTLKRYNISIKVQGDEIIVTGIDKEATGNVAARLEQLTRINDRDRRKFQDGIFIVEKAGKAI
jgi:large subunit ribosomal protein L6